MDRLDFLLVLCPPWGFDTAPLGPAYVMEALEKGGYRAAFADVNRHLAQVVRDDRALAERLSEITGFAKALDLWDLSSILAWHNEGHLDALFDEFAPYIESFLSGFLASKPDLLGASIYQDNLDFSVRTARLIHRMHPALLIVFGGPWSAVIHRDRSVESYSADLIVFGEGETALPLVLDQLAGVPQKQRRAWLGATYPQGLKAKSVDVDAVASPRYAGFDLDAYRPKQICVITSRGCPKRCVFCADRILMGRYRERSLENVLDELEFVVGRLNVNHVTFNDLNLGANVQRLIALANGIVKREIRFSWIANLSVDARLDEAAFSLLVESGATQIQFGIESGSPRILKLMGKDFTPETALNNLKAAHRAGLKIRVNFVTGFPFESDEDFSCTAAFLDQVGSFLERIGSINTLFILPMTRLASETERLGVEPIFGPVPLEWNWMQKDADPKTRIERARRLIEIAHANDLPVLQTNVEINRLLLLRQFGRDVTDSFPLRAKGARLCPINATTFLLKTQSDSRIIELGITSVQTAVLHPHGGVDVTNPESETTSLDEVVFDRGSIAPMLRLTSDTGSPFDFSFRTGETQQFFIAPTATLFGREFQSDQPLAQRQAGDISVVFADRQLMVNWKGRPCTSFPHLYFDVDLPDGRRLRSFDGPCCWILTDAAQTDALSAAVCWPDVDFYLGIHLRVTPGRLVGSLAALASTAVQVLRVKAGLGLDGAFDRFGTSDEIHRMSARDRDQWTVVGPRDAKGRLPFDEKYAGRSDRLFAQATSENRPLVSMQANPADGILPVVQKGCHIGPGLGFYRLGGTMDPGRTSLVTFTIQFTQS